MSLKSFFTILAISFSTIVFAQKTRIDFNKNANGKFSLEQYAKNIYKIIYSPNGYSTNENISDAVILKPNKISKLPKNISSSNGKIKINNKTFLLETFDDNGFRGFDFELQPREEIYGGGERAIPFNRQGYAFEFYNKPWYAYGEGADNLNYSVPFFISNKGYGIFFDNPSKGFVDIGKSTANIFKAGFMSGELNFYIITGKNIAEILSSYNKLTGTQPLPPKWALGNLMSRFGYTSETQVNNIYSKMRQQKFPVDAIIFDLFWFGDSIKGSMGNLDWINKTKWPNPKRMIENFKSKNVQSILVSEPFILNSSSNYENSKKFHAVDKNRNPFLITDFYFGSAGLIDIFRKDAQDWFWTKHIDQIKNGVEAWWGDLGEPERHPQDLYHNLKDLGYKRLFSADEVHNIYGHNWTKMLFNKYAKYFPEKRLFSLNRSGFAGSQRFGIFPWSGDVGRTWSGLRAQLPIMLGMSMSGIPYIHADAGGFAGGTGDLELYVRWLQFASFTPIFRPHGTALYEIDKDAFSFPSEPALIDSPYRNYVKDYIDLRYRLLPYNYTLAYHQTTKGKPLVAPLAYYFPEDTIAKKIENQFMWGENILVAPILEKEQKEKLIYLPKGKTWFDISDLKNGMIKNKISIDENNMKDSIHNYQLNTDLETMPLFAKEGSFITLDGTTNFSTTSDLRGDTLIILYFESKTSSSNEIFFDDGESKSSLKNKKYELIKLNSSGGKSVNYITISSVVNSNYKGKPKKRFIKFYPYTSFSSIEINGKTNLINTNLSLPSAEFEYVGKPIKIKLMN